MSANGTDSAENGTTNDSTTLNIHNHNNISTANDAKSDTSTVLPHNNNFKVTNGATNDSATNAIHNNTVKVEDNNIDDLTDQLNKLDVTTKRQPVTLPSVSSDTLIPLNDLTKQRTGIVYDDRCLLHSANYLHVEQPARTGQSMSLLLKHNNLLQHCQHQYCRLATDTELLLTHPQSHIDMLDATLTYDYKPAEPDSDKPNDTTLYHDCKWLDNDTYVNQYSAHIARLAVGGLIDLTNKVVLNELDNGFAIIRPPGHHSSCSRASGFCLYNNVAVAAGNVIKQHSDKIKRVAIVDFDVHHGDGTQDIFYNRSDVLYFSIHRYQNRTFYPYTGGVDECGTDAGTGYTVNMPLNETQMSDAQYLDCWDNLLIPILQQYKPDILYISAGFDCALGDPLGGNEVSPECFAHLTHKLMDLSIGHQGRVICALEGGYNVRAVSESVVSCITALTKQSLPTLPNNILPINSKHALKLQSKYIQFKHDLRDAITVQSKYWKLHQIDIPPLEVRRSSRQASNSTTPITSPIANNTTTPPTNFKTYIKQQRSTAKKTHKHNNVTPPKPITDETDTLAAQLQQTTITTTNTSADTTTIDTTQIHQYTSKHGKKYTIQPYSNQYRDSTLDCIGRVQSEYSNLAGLTVHDQPDVLDITTHFQAPNAGCFYIAVDTDTNKVIGTSGSKILSSTEAALRKMYVDSTYRGHGIGYNLLNVTLQYSDQCAITDVYLGTSVPMVEAHKFYHKNGFQYVDVTAMPSNMPLTLKFDTIFMHRHNSTTIYNAPNTVQSISTVKKDVL